MKLARVTSFQIIAILLSFTLGTTLVNADATSNRTEALDDLSNALEKEKNLSPDTKQALDNLIDALRTESPDINARREQLKRDILIDMEKRASMDDSFMQIISEVVDKLKIKADLRLRHESNFELPGAKNRHRQRVRARVAANWQVVEELLIGGRLITGDRDDPNSPHQTLGSSTFNSFEVSLDRAFATYRPESIEGLYVTAGKFGHPFQTNPVYGELVWDGDVQPEGVVIGYTKNREGKLEKISIVAGEYIVLEQGGGSEVLMTVIQVAGHCRLSENVTADASVGYYYYGNPTPDWSLGVIGDNSGNAVIDTNGDMIADQFVSDFGIINPIIAVTCDAWNVPVTVSGEYIYNSRAKGDRDEGWAVGVAAGKTKKEGDCRVYYQWQVVEQDAVFSPFAQDDFLLTTNHRSHVFGVKYLWFDKATLHLWALVSEPDHPMGGSNDNRWRIRFDLNIKN